LSKSESGEVEEGGGRTPEDKQFVTQEKKARKGSGL